MKIMAAAALVHVSERGKDLKKYALLPRRGRPGSRYNVAKKLTVKKLICPRRGWGRLWACSWPRAN